MVRKILFAVLLFAMLGVSCSRKEKPVLKLVAQGFNQPLFVTQPASDHQRLFVVEQSGAIRIIRDGKVLTKQFLDLRPVVWSGGEMGLLSLAFHPDYHRNGFFYVYYIDRKRRSMVVRYHVSADPDVADPSSAHVLLHIHKPYRNHNGGLLRFGPDGMFYVGMGDGGRSGDPKGNAQDRSTLFGDMLRIDVDHGDPYSIPADNPYVNQTDIHGEIWHFGLRNPWRYAFDHETGLLYIADVGEKGWEEINAVPAKQSGLNFGWNIMEGTHCFKGLNCSKEGLVLPIAEYTHQEGCAIVGGVVYRGKELPSLRGHYFYGDYCLGWIRSFKYEDGRVTGQRQWDFGVVGNILSFGEDSDHNMYVCYENGKVYRLAAES